MDLSTLKGYMPSLADYLGGGKTSYFDSVAQSLAAKTANAYQVASEASGASSSVNVTLSDEAKKILEQGNVVNGTTKISGVQKAGQDFLMGFFDKSGLDLENLSGEALDLIQGLQDVVAGSSASQRDFSTDMLEAQVSGGNRTAYTLTGQGSRLRIAMQSEDGKPQKLSITDIVNGQVETADITITSEDGKAVMKVERTQRAYENGHMVTLAQIEPLSIKLYKSA